MPEVEQPKGARISTNELSAASCAPDQGLVLARGRGSGGLFSFVSKIESDKVNHFAHPLHKLVRVLETNIAALFSDGPDEFRSDFPAGLAPLIRMDPLRRQEHRCSRRAAGEARFCKPISTASIRAEGDGRIEHEGEEVGLSARRSSSFASTTRPIFKARGDSFFFPRISTLATRTRSDRDPSDLDQHAADLDPVAGALDPSTTQELEAHRPSSPAPSCRPIERQERIRMIGRGLALSRRRRRQGTDERRDGVTLRAELAGQVAQGLPIETRWCTEWKDAASTSARMPRPLVVRDPQQHARHAAEVTSNPRDARRSTTTPSIGGDFARAIEQPRAGLERATSAASPSSASTAMSSSRDPERKRSRRARASSSCAVVMRASRSTCNMTACVTLMPSWSAWARCNASAASSARALATLRRQLSDRDLLRARTRYARSSTAASPAPAPASAFHIGLGAQSILMSSSPAWTTPLPARRRCAR